MRFRNLYEGITTMANENIETTERFSKHQVTVTMLGEEWFALLCRAIGQPLSVPGA